MIILCSCVYPSNFPALLPVGEEQNKTFVSSFQINCTSEYVNQ